VASPAATRTEAPTRLAFVDNVRSGMIVLVLGMHAAVTYSPFGSWFLREHPPLTQAEAMFFLTFQAFLQGFFMALLFFVAGCFTPDAYDRKGAVRFLADRTYRLGLPALLFALIIGPVMRYFLIGSWDTARSFPIAMAAYIASGQVLSGTGPLWFCVALLIFSVGYTLWRLAQPRAFAIRDLTTRHVVFALLAMAVGTFLTKTVIPGGKAIFNLQLADFPSYVVLFAAGIVAGRSGWLTHLPNRFLLRISLWCLSAAILCWWPLLALGGALSGDTAAYNFGWTWQNAAASIWAALVCIGGSAGVLVLFRVILPGHGTLSRFLSANAFAVYVIHPPVLVALALALRASPTDDPLVKFALLWFLGALLTFGVVAPAVRRVPFLRDILR
jgi:hypothetical protein